MTTPDSTPAVPGDLIARARDSSDPGELAELASRDTCPEVLQQVAGNPATPPRTLELIVITRNPAIRLAAARNPSVPPHALDSLTIDDDPAVRLAVARNPHVPADKLGRLVTHERQSARWRMEAVQERNGQHRPGDYPALSADETAVLAAVASHPQTSADTLARLGGSLREDEVRLAAAANPNTPAVFLGRLLSPRSFGMYGRYQEPSPALRDAVFRVLRQRDTPEARRVLQRLE